MNPNDSKITKPVLDKPLNNIIKYYPDSNSKHKEYNLNENNQYHGPYEEWYPNGQIRLRCSYQNNMQRGLYESWHPDGSLYFRCNLVQ